MITRFGVGHVRDLVCWVIAPESIVVVGSGMKCSNFRKHSERALRMYLSYLGTSSPCRCRVRQSKSRSQNISRIN